jgi:hypothetical protein
MILFVVVVREDVHGVVRVAHLTSVADDPRLNGPLAA